ncbi:MAG TPA: hypothetical protein VK211_19195 [Kamptonema sp.]|nr:hypothetical protein [Kamptonema sp.]
MLSPRHESLNLGTNLIKYPQPPEILTYIHSGKLVMVDSGRRHGLILMEGDRAEFAGLGRC